MPATFTHCLIARKALDLVKDKHPYAGRIATFNQFAMMGAASPDYPYLTDVISGMLGGHNWANRMHYENTSYLVQAGAKKLSQRNKDNRDFFCCLSWLCGYVSHVIADSYLHPVVNSVVGGIYMFTHTDHRTCEMIWDVYIFNKETKDAIRYANPRSGFGYLNILKDCSDPNDSKRLYPAVSQLWIELLKEAHPNAKDNFDTILPDRWHENYVSRVDFSANPQPIFRHVWGIKDFVYRLTSDITPDEKEKYINRVLLPDKRVVHLDVAFNETMQKIAVVWEELFKYVEKPETHDLTKMLRDWNLDTGVDEDRIYFWHRGGTR